MIDEATARGLVYEVIDIVNQQLPAARRLAKSPETIIVGAGGSLDSLAVVNFVIALEEKVSEAAGTPVQLLDDSMAIGNTPFSSVGALARHIAAPPGVTR